MTTTAQDQAIVQVSAVFSNAVYGESANIPSGWQPIDNKAIATINNTSTGYQAQVYVNHDTRQIMFANAGTNDFKDVASWNTVVTGSLSPQMQDAILAGNIVKGLVTTVDTGYTGYTVITTGHSWGEAEAQLQASTFGWKGVGFDGPGAWNIVAGSAYSSFLQSQGITPVGAADFISCNTNGIVVLGGGLVGSLGADIAGVRQCTVELPGSAASAIFNGVLTIAAGPAGYLLGKGASGIALHDMQGINGAVQAGHFQVVPDAPTPAQAQPFSFIDSQGNVFSGSEKSDGTISLSQKLPNGTVEDSLVFTDKSAVQTDFSDITRSVITKLSQVGSDNSCRVEDYTTDAQGNWVTTTSFFTTGFDSPTKGAVKEIDTNRDGSADDILLITPQTNTQITQPSANTKPAAATTADPLSNALDTVRNSLAGENDELVDSTELRTLTGAESSAETWGGARLLEISESSLADWYNTSNAWYEQGIEADPVTEDTGLNGYAVDYGTQTPTDYDGLNILEDFNEGGTTSFWIYGSGDSTAFGEAPSYDDYYADFSDPSYINYNYSSTSGTYNFTDWDSAIGSLDYYPDPFYLTAGAADYSFYGPFGWYEPLALDLDGDGIELIKKQDSRAYYDVTGDGFRRNVAWVGSQDGLLAIDKDGDGKIALADELSFALWTTDPNDTDLGGLKAYFDTNHNGLLDAGDARFADMRLWQDLNSDGVNDAGELKTLAQAGIASVSLTAAHTDWNSGGSHISGFTTYQKSDGTMRWAADVGLGYEADGWKSIDSGTFMKITQSGGLNYAISKGTALNVDLGAQGLQGAIGGASADVLNAASRAVAVLLEGGGGNDSLTGGSKDDWLNGGAGSDTLKGGDGDDTLVIDASDLQANLLGGNGFDIVMVSGTAAVTLNLAPGAFEAAVGGDGNDNFSTTGNWRVVLAGDKGNDTLTGGSNSDLLTGGAGADQLDGGTGTDTAAFDGLRTGYSVTKGTGSYTVNGMDGTDTLLNIERLHFGDLDVALDPTGTGTAGQTYRAFEAALGRAPDVTGMGYFMYQLDRGTALVSVAAQLIGSPEFVSHYGGNLTNSQYVTLLYNNALHRAPDADGLAYWLNMLASDPTATRASVLTGFSESPECQTVLMGVITQGVDYLPGA